MEIGPLSSPEVTSYRLPIVTIVLYLTFFALFRLVMDARTDRGNWFSKRGHCVLKCIGRQNRLQTICRLQAALLSMRKALQLLTRPHVPMPLISIHFTATATVRRPDANRSKSTRPYQPLRSRHVVTAHCLC